jgi:hypothetical protein
MKKSIRISILFIVGFSLLSFSSERHLVNKSFNEPLGEEKNEGIRCKVYNDDGDLIASCWFCSCNNLAKGALNHL